MGEHDNLIGGVTLRVSLIHAQRVASKILASFIGTSTSQQQKYMTDYINYLSYGRPHQVLCL